MKTKFTGSRRRDGNRLLDDLNVIAGATENRGVVAVERPIAQLGLPFARVENQVAFRTGNRTSHGLIVQPHIDGVLQVMADGFTTLEYAAGRHPDRIFGECSSHGIDVSAIVGFRKVLLDVGKAGIVDLIFSSPIA